MDPELVILPNSRDTGTAGSSHDAALPEILPFRGTSVKGTVEERKGRPKADSCLKARGQDSACLIGERRAMFSTLCYNTVSWVLRVPAFVCNSADA